MTFLKKAYTYLAYYGIAKFCYYLPRLMFFYFRRASRQGDCLIRTINHKYKMYINLKQRGISGTLYFHGTRERDQVHVVRSVLKPGMRVMDIGANIGYYTLMEADLVGKSGKVYAFEPDQSNFNLLKKNIELNNYLDRVELCPRGVSDSDGERDFFISPESNLHTFNPTNYGFKKPDSIFLAKTRIDVIDISRFLKQKGPIDFIRMDVEGHEVEILNGIFKGLDDIGYAPSVLLETHFSKYDDNLHDMRTVLSNIFAKGYHIGMLISNNEPNLRIRGIGYKPDIVFKTDRMYRGIYHNVKKEHALGWICEAKGIRALYLKHTEN